MVLTDYLNCQYLPNRIALSTGYKISLRTTVHQFSRHLGWPADLDDLTRATISAWLSAIAPKVSAVTVNNKRRQLLTLARAAHADGLLPTVPIVRRLTEPEPTPEAWTLEQCEAVFRMAAQWPSNSPTFDWLSLWVVVYWTGARIGGLLEAGSKDYLPDKGLWVRKQKNKRAQWHPLPLSCRVLIDATRPETRQLIWDWPRCRREFFREARAIVDASGVPSPRGQRNLFHRMRRTCLTLCDVVDPVLAQRQAGHADYRTTRRHYIDPSLSTRLSAADVLPEPMVPAGNVVHLRVIG